MARNASTKLTPCQTPFGDGARRRLIDLAEQLVDGVLAGPPQSQAGQRDAHLRDR